MADSEHQDLSVLGVLGGSRCRQIANQKCYSAKQAFAAKHESKIKNALSGFTP
jgi:hypothetical protein